MGSLGNGVWIAPHADREPLVAAALRAAGAEGDAWSFRAEPGSLGRLQDLVAVWDLGQLAHEYRAFLERFSRGGGSAFKAQTELVHAWRRLAFLDPDLPAELLPRGWPRAAAHRLFRRRSAAWGAGAQERFAELEEPM
jgi:phenylacetic acid degradation operon negative regulatory protein